MQQLVCSSFEGPEHRMNEFEALGFTWRFMGSYKLGEKSPTMGCKSIVTLLITLPITTHEPPSRV